MSRYARPRSRSSTKSSLGTRLIASRTRWSAIPRAASWSATMARRASSRSGTYARPHGGRRLDAEMLEHERRQVRDRRLLRNELFLEARRQEGNRRVAGRQRAVAAAARVVAPPQVGKLP